MATTEGKRWWFVLTCLLILGLAASCASPAAAPAPTPQATTAAPRAESPVAKTAATPAAPSPSPKPATEQPRYGGVLTVSGSVDPVTLDIHQESGTSSLEPLVPAYNGLVQCDLRTWKVVGDLAERWEVSPDALTYTFYLYRGVKWHDGKAFSSADVRASMERQKDPPKTMRAARKEQFDSVDRIETPDENTVKIVMKQPYVAFMAQFATDWFAIFPKHLLEAKGDMKKDVLGTGPFKFKSYGSGVSIELVKNPDYFIKGLPYLDGITHYIIKDGASRFAAFRTGRVKMTGHFAGLTPTEAATVKAEYPQLPLWRFPALSCPRYPINCFRPPFSDVRVRQAVSLAYDRQTAIKVLGEGEGRLGTFVPQGEWGLTEAEILKLPGYRQPKDADRAEAKRLLAEAGYPNGFKMTHLVRATRQDQRAGEFMKDQLASIGIDAAIDVAEKAVYDTHTRPGTFQIGSQLNTWRINDPDELSRKFLTDADQNYGRWSSKRFDELFAEQSRTLDTAKRRSIARELDEILLREWPDISAFWADDILATWPEVKNFASPPGRYSSMKLQDIWLAK